MTNFTLSGNAPNTYYFHIAKSPSGAQSFKRNLMKKLITTGIFLCASSLLQTAHADQQFKFTESFTNPNDLQSTMVLSGTFSQAANGVITNLSTQILENGDYLATMQDVSISAFHFIELPQSVANGFPLQISGYFLGPAGNRNTITSCGQIYLNGPGCSLWHDQDPTVVPHGLTDIRTGGAGVGGDVLSQYYFAQTGALQIAAVPEPSSVLMLLAGLGMVYTVRRKARGVAPAQRLC